MEQPHQPRRSIAVVVDDDAAQRFLCGTLFEEADFEVAECATADEAWELIQNRRDDVQLLFPTFICRATWTASNLRGRCTTRCPTYR